MEPRAAFFSAYAHTLAGHGLGGLLKLAWETVDPGLVKGFRARAGTTAADLMAWNEKLVGKGVVGKTLSLPDAMGLYSQGVGWTPAVPSSTKLPKMTQWLGPKVKMRQAIPDLPSLPPNILSLTQGGGPVDRAKSTAGMSQVTRATGLREVRAAGGTSVGSRNPLSSAVASGKVKAVTGKVKRLAKPLAAAKAAKPLAVVAKAAKPLPAVGRVAKAAIKPLPAVASVVRPKAVGAIGRAVSTMAKPFRAVAKSGILRRLFRLAA